MDASRLDEPVYYTCASRRHHEAVYFRNMADDELREFLNWRNPKITRTQLLTACHNRYRCGYYVKIEDESVW